VDELQQRLSLKQDELIAADDMAAAARQQAERVLGTRPAATRPAGAAVDPVDEDFELGVGSAQEQQALRLEILQAHAQLQELQQKYMAEHPSVTTLRRRLNRLNRLYLASIEQRAATLRTQVERLKAEVRVARTELAQLDAHAARYKEIRAEIERVRGIRDTFDGKIRQTKVERDTGGVTIDVIDAAKPADRPSLPDKRKVMVIAVALGLVLGMVLAALREWLDDRMRSAREIKSSLGMPLLAVIPQSVTKRSFSVSGQRVLLDPASDAAEAYRSLRTAIQFSAPDGLKTLLVASPNSGDGKTTLVTNLGIAMAQAGKRVCIVDADLRKPDGPRHLLAEDDARAEHAAGRAVDAGRDGAARERERAGRAAVRAGPGEPGRGAEQPGVRERAGRAGRPVRRRAAGQPAGAVGGRRPGDRRVVRRDADRADGPVGPPPEHREHPRRAPERRGSDHRPGRERRPPAGRQRVRHPQGHAAARPRLTNQEYDILQARGK
jgi:nitrogenase subunit NifH